MATATNYLKLEWWNSCDLGEIYYTGGYRNRAYFETEVGKPDYQLEQETEPNGEGVDVILSQVRKKIYQFEVYVPEYMVDALVDMALHDNIRITYTNGLYSSAIRNVQVIPNWEEMSSDCMATVIVKFQQDDQLVDNSCCTPMDVLECLTPCIEVVGFKADHAGAWVEGAIYIEDSGSSTLVEYQGGGNFAEISCANNYVYSSDAGMEMFWNGSAWYEAPEITSLARNVMDQTFLIIGQALPSTFLQAYYSSDGVTYAAIGSPFTVADFNAGVSFELNPLPVTLYVKVFMYNHNCQYQYSKPAVD